MYQGFYHLSADPFRLTPDPRFCFHHQAYAKAWAYMRYALEVGEGFVVVTGEPGTGKTTLTEALIQDLKHSSILSIRLVGTHLAATDLLRNMAYSFEIDADSLDRTTLVHRIEQYLITQSRSERRVLLVLDEAQSISDTALEELRLLADMQMSGKPLIQVFLLGQERLHRVLDTPDLEQFRQRIIAACHLNKLNLKETRDFIEHRLRCAGWQGDPQFSGRAVLSLYRHTHGLPRHINKMCSRLILRGYTEEKHALGENDVLAVVSELDDEKLAPLDYEHDVYVQQGMTRRATGSGYASALLDKLAIQIPKKAQRVGAPTPSSSTTDLPAQAQRRLSDTPNPANRHTVPTGPQHLVNADGTENRRKSYRWGYKSKPRVSARLAALLLRVIRAAVAYANSAGKALYLKGLAGLSRPFTREAAHRTGMWARERDRARGGIARVVGFSSKLSGVAGALVHRIRAKRPLAIALSVFLMTAMVFATIGVKNWRDAENPDSLLARQQDVSTEQPEDTAATDGVHTQKSAVEAEDVPPKLEDASGDMLTDTMHPLADTLEDQAGTFADDSSAITDMDGDRGNLSADKKYPEVSGKVVHDIDGDGIYDEMVDRGIAGVTVELRDDNDRVIAVTMSDDEGIYRFENVRDGNYEVVITDVNDALFGYILIAGSLETPVSIVTAGDDLSHQSQGVFDYDIAPLYGIFSASDELYGARDAGRVLDTVDVHDFETLTGMRRDAIPPGTDCLSASECGGSAKPAAPADVAVLDEKSRAPGFEYQTSGADDNLLEAQSDAPRARPALMYETAPASGSSDEGDTRLTDLTKTDSSDTPSSPDVTKPAHYPPLSILPVDQRSADNTHSDVQDAPRDTAQDAVSALISAARQALEENRLLIPHDDNAVHYFKQILALDPGNAEASAGIHSVADRYLQLAQQAIEDGADKKARRYIARGLRVDSGNDDLLSLRSVMAAKQAESELREAAMMMEGDLPPPVPVEDRSQGFLQRMKSYFNADNAPATVDEIE